MCTVVAELLRGFDFRTSKYTKYWGKKSSEDSLVDKIRKKFGTDGKAIVIFWGNWGKAPNALRNGPPTPGIGIRRFVHRRLLNDRRQLVQGEETRVVGLKGWGLKP